MKILLLNYTDAGGGAAIAAYRLTKALVEHGVDAVLGVVEKKSTDDFVVQIPWKKKNCLQKSFPVYGICLSGGLVNLWISYYNSLIRNKFFYKIVFLIVKIMNKVGKMLNILHD